MKIMVVNKENIEGHNKYLRDDMDVEDELHKLYTSQADS